MSLARHLIEEKASNFDVCLNNVIDSQLSCIETELLHSKATIPELTLGRNVIQGKLN